MWPLMHRFNFIVRPAVSLYGGIILMIQFRFCVANDDCSLDVIGFLFIYILNLKIELEISFIKYLKYNRIKKYKL